MSLRSNWLDVVDRAFKWADPKNPFAAHTSLRPYMTRVPRETLADPGVPVDREFWLGEVLDDMRREAARKLSPADLADYDRYVASKMADLDRKRIPMLGSKANPPRVHRAQKVVAKLDKDPRPVKPGGVIQGPDQLVRDVLADYLSGRATEVFLILYVNVRNQIVGFNEYAEGSVAGVTVQTSGILRDALVSGAAAFITVHQHPTGDPTPSDDDRELWKRLRAAGELVGIPVLDNLVIGDDGRFFSEGQGMGRVIVSRAASKEGP